MNQYQQGDIVLLPFPFTDLTTTKQRPAVVISTTAFNERHSDVIVAAITSQLTGPKAAEDVTLSESASHAAGLLKQSKIKSGKIVTISKELIRKKIGRLSSAAKTDVQKKLQLILFATKA